MVIKGLNPTGLHLEKQLGLILLFNGFVILQKDTLPKETKLHSSLQETNQKERLLNYKFLNGLVKVIKEFFLDQMVISDVTQNSNLNSLTNLKKSVVKSTLYLTTEIKLSICGDKEELL